MPNCSCWKPMLLLSNAWQDFYHKDSDDGIFNDIQLFHTRNIWWKNNTYFFVLISLDSHYLGYCLPNCHPIFKKCSYGLNIVATALLMVFELFIHYTFDMKIEIVTLECISRCYQTLTILDNLLLVTDTQNPESQWMDHQKIQKVSDLFIHSIVDTVGKYF